MRAGVNVSASINLTCLTPGDTSTCHLFFFLRLPKSTNLHCALGKKVDSPSLPIFFMSKLLLFAWKWPHFSIAEHIEFTEHFRMSISYSRYYNKITSQWNTLSSHLKKCSSVKYILTYQLPVWKWKTIKSRQACMEGSANVNTVFQCSEKSD